jgi:methylenetetrahydrofolate reductase (NADPH)
VTQFCFDAAAIVSWLAALRRDGIASPVRIGLAGPANVATLVRFAIRCGVTNSVRALTSRPDRFMRLVADSAPDGLVRGIGAGAGPELLAGVSGLHFFPFGGVAKSARWANAVRRGRFRLGPGGGLDVEI